ncbi:hypothetical protein [Methylocella tundrae]|uniref:hypothetical protein n=1 Tax=Methylocella tundrae TaxID=227605 RepID=UPI00157B52D4|nr:hypothetical protein [Methylocella tundrae]
MIDCRENPADDGGLAFHDLQRSLVASRRRIAIGETVGIQPLSDSPGHLSLPLRFNCDVAERG